MEGKIQVKHQISIRGTIFDITVIHQNLERFKDSVFEAIISGRHEVEKVDDIPFLDRDPEVFQRMMEIINSNPMERYQVMNFDEQVLNELEFFGLDFEALNRKMLQDLFSSKPVEDKDGYPPNF